MNITKNRVVKKKEIFKVVYLTMPASENRTIEIFAFGPDYLFNMFKEWFPTKNGFRWVEIKQDYNIASHAENAAMEAKNRYIAQGFPESHIITSISIRVVMNSFASTPKHIV